MANQTEIDQINDVCNRIIATVSNSLLERNEWGEINFLAAEEDINHGREIAKSWSTTDLGALPSNNVNSINQHLENFTNYLNQIQNFKIANNAEKQRNQIVANIRNTVGQLVSVSAPWLPFLQIHSQGLEKYIGSIEAQLGTLQLELKSSSETKERLVEENEQRANAFNAKIGEADTKLQEFDEKIAGVILDAKAEADKLLKDAETSANNIKEEADKILQDARAYAADKAIAPYTEFFEKTATKLNKTANLWLACTVVIILVTSYWACINLSTETAMPFDTPEIIRYFTTRALVTGLLITALYWTGKQYRICKHQNTINQHKADALKSFEAFIDASNEDETRDAVLLQTTHTIFAQEPTGYLDSKEAGTLEQYSKLISTVKGAASTVAKPSG